jgi:hypothetical protein
MGAPEPANLFVSGSIIDHVAHRRAADLKFGALLSFIGGGFANRRRGKAESKPVAILRDGRPGR